MTQILKTRLRFRFASILIWILVTGIELGVTPMPTFTGQGMSQIESSSSTIEPPRDHIDAQDDQDFERMLELALEESANSIGRPENFVDDDLPVEEIEKLFEQVTSQPGEEITTNQQQTDLQATGEDDDIQRTTMGAFPAPANDDDQLATTTPQPCPICLDDLNQDALDFKLKCGHDFHGGCLRSWLRSAVSISLLSDKLVILHLNLSHDTHSS